MAKQGGSGKSSKKDQPTRKRYLSQDQRQVNKMRRNQKRLGIEMRAGDRRTTWFSRSLKRAHRRAHDPAVQLRADIAARDFSHEQANKKKVDVGQI